ncbi:MAG: hypothetical protein ACOZNI_24745 [Myxococcota bacterium]
MDNRRAFLRMSVFGLATAGIGLPSVARAASSASPAAVAGEAPTWLVHPLAPGDEIGLGWRLARMYPPVDGAVTLNLLHEDGRAARVDLCLLEGEPKGPAHTTCIDFIVMDGGDGASPMDESLGRVVVRLAAIVGDNEGKHLDGLVELEAHADRVWRHADALAIASRKLSPGTS